MVGFVFRLTRLLSIDVALAALGGGILAERTVHSFVPPSFFILLPLSVWVVYTLDHLLDARRMGAAAHTERHRFHHRHWTVLAMCCGVGGLVCAILAFVGLSWLGLVFGMVMGCGVLLHLAIVKIAGGYASPLLMKELGVAIIFTAGVWGLPAIRHGPVDWPVVVVMQYFLLALVNLLEFSLFDLEADRADRQTSFVQGVGPRWGKRVTIMCLVTVVSIAGMMLAYRHERMMVATEVIYLAMAGALLTLLLFPRWMAKGDRYRAIGDGAFILPILCLLVR